MALLTLLVLALVMISGNATRVARSELGQVEARQNARLSLMLAMGELQKTTGPDTRVTARADVLDAQNPPVLGAWKSWEGSNHTASGPAAGRPISPGSDYKKVKEARSFPGWYPARQPRPPTAPPCRTWPRAAAKSRLSARARSAQARIATSSRSMSRPPRSPAAKRRAPSPGGLAAKTKRHACPCRINRRATPSPHGPSGQIPRSRDPAVFRMDVAERRDARRQGGHAATMRSVRRNDNGLAAPPRNFSTTFGHLRRLAHQYRHRRLAQGSLAAHGKPGAASRNPACRFSGCPPGTTACQSSRPAAATVPTDRCFIPGPATGATAIPIYEHGAVRVGKTCWTGPRCTSR